MERDELNREIVQFFVNQTRQHGKTIRRAAEELGIPPTTLFRTINFRAYGQSPNSGALAKMVAYLNDAEEQK